MASPLPLPLLQYQYEKAAEEYCRNLPLEHFMEAAPHATQREITLESLALVKAQRTDVHVFNELLVQYPRRGRDLGQVVPDNMVVVWKESLTVLGSYDLPLQPARPYWVLEYVSKNSKRKDYQDSFQKYEEELKVPYCMMFYHEAQELTLFRRGRDSYRSDRANRQGRFPIPKLELELALLDGWVRYWFRGELLPLPAELQQQLNDVRRQLQKRERQLEEKGRQLEEKGRQLQDLDRQLEEERQARLALEQELARLRGQGSRPNHK